MEYEHTQPGTLIRVVMGTALVVMIAAVLYSAAQNRDPEWPALIPAGILMVCLMLFHSLTVRVTSNDLRLSFGAGLIQKQFLVSDFESAKLVRTRWYHGWGIKKIWGGWLYNVSGFDAVQIDLRGGKICQIGTDQPEELLAAVRNAIKQNVHPANH